MTDKEREIQQCYTKWAEKGLKDRRNMTIEEEKKYIDENEPKMRAEIREIVKKYENIDNKK